MKTIMSWTRGALAALLVLACGLVVVTGPSNAQGTKAGRVMLVLDASGSMWGQIDGVSKIEIARTEIDRLLGSWSGGVELGVIAYGHREKGNCSDIETVVPVQPIDRAKTMAAIRALSPKGKTPISAAVSRAAEDLRYTEDKATVVLVSDGLETCEADPCAVASTLESAGVDFQVHVVGFDLTPEETASLRCIADNTGGRFFPVGSAKELASAFDEAAETIVAAEPEEPAGPQGFRLATVLAEGEPALERDVFYWIYESETDLNGKRKEIARNGSAQPVIEMPVGTYRVIASYGKAKVALDLTVEPGTMTDATFVLNAGHVRAQAIAAEGADPLEDDLFYWLYEDKKDLNGNRKEVARNGSAQAFFRVPAGDYHLVVRHGKATASQTVTVTPAALTEVTLTLNAGYLRAVSVVTEGADPLDDDVFYWLYSQETDLNGKREEIALNGAATALFKVPAGTYHLVSRFGNAFARQDVTVTANQLTDVTLNLQAGAVRAKTVYTQGGDVIDRNVFYWVFENETDLNGRRKEIARNGSTQALFQLPAGTYLLQSRFGGANAYASQTIVIEPGKMQDITLDANAGTVIAEVVDGATGAKITDRSRVFWWVYGTETDARGKREEIARNGNARAVLDLAAGEYLLAVKAGNRSAEQVITVVPGAQMPVSLTVN